MPALAQNTGSWSATFLMLGLAFVAAWLMAGIGTRIGLAERTTRRCATALGLVALLCAPLPLRYSLQVLDPFAVLLLWLVTAHALLGVAHIRRPRLLWGALTAAYALALALTVWTSACVVLQADTLRHLSLDDVRRIELQGPRHPADRVALTATYEIADVLDALTLTVPYTPNREEFERGYRLTIHTARGPLVLQLYRGRQARLDTGVLALPPPGGLARGPAYYENQHLYWLLVTNYRFPAWFPQ